MNQVDTDAIIHDVENRLAIFISMQTDLDARVGLTTHEFGGIVDQVLNSLKQTSIVTINRWEVFVNKNVNPPALNLALHKFNCLMGKFFKRNTGWEN